MKYLFVRTQPSTCRAVALSFLNLQKVFRVWDPSQPYTVKYVYDSLKFVASRGAEKANTITAL